jgi:transcriptional regulator with XRE-family HTH domain
MSQDLKSANSAKIGKGFSDARKNLNLSIEEVASKALINIKYIKAIESGDYSDFPSEGFSRAYYRKYATFLNLKLDFPAIYATENRKNKIIKKSFPISSQPIYKLLISSLFIVIILVTVFLFLQATGKNQIKNDSNILITKVSEANILKIIQDVQMNFDINEEIKSNNQIEDNFNEAEILLYFKDECWIEIYSNEELIEYQLFNSGDNFSMTIRKPFTIVVGNAEAVIGSYEGSNIDFITNANRLRVNTIIFNYE